MALMGGKGGGKNSLAAKPNLLSALARANQLLWTGDPDRLWTEPHCSAADLGRRLSGHPAHQHNQSRRQGAGLRRRECNQQHHLHLSNCCGHGLMPGANPEHP